MVLLLPCTTLGAAADRWMGRTRRGGGWRGGGGALLDAAHGECGAAAAVSKAWIVACCQCGSSVRKWKEHGARRARSSCRLEIVPSPKWSAESICVDFVCQPTV